jgi:hypothetical protein
VLILRASRASPLSLLSFSNLGAHS